jgi:hypothetical protein
MHDFPTPEFPIIKILINCESLRYILFIRLLFVVLHCIQKILYGQYYEK